MLDHNYVADRMNSVAVCLTGRVLWSRSGVAPGGRAAASLRRRPSCHWHSSLLHPAHSQHPIQHSAYNRTFRQTTRTYTRSLILLSPWSFNEVFNPWIGEINVWFCSLCLQFSNDGPNGESMCLQGPDCFMVSILSISFLTEFLLLKYYDISVFRDHAWNSYS